MRNQMRSFRPVQPPVLQKSPISAYYREYAPCKSLEKYVACYWTSETGAIDRQQWNRVIPDGCVDIIFDLKTSSSSEGAFVTGLMRTFELMPIVGHQSIFGIRLYSEMAHYFLRYPISSINGYRVYLEDLWGMEARRVVERLAEVTAITDRIALIEESLIRYLVASPIRSEGLLETSMQYIYACGGSMPIGALAEKVNYSERNLRRVFQNELGVSPKELIRIIQFQSFLQELVRGTQATFTDVALQYGYYDQSHVIKNFKAYYGMSPRRIFSADEPK
ncbi:helix-turn-helix domain-containing protein [uncultured Brevibacillus sp.]|uniref:AraC family transcriptional regulator n=1 Tax=uncultured Brevibacillus sp. TaxID=169970 RepID=UPI002594AA68|nr:helix-turn-helix domain-containing protein [uncultured Brevibacillus sp.]